MSKKDDMTSLTSMKNQLKDYIDNLIKLSSDLIAEYHLNQKMTVSMLTNITMADIKKADDEVLQSVYKAINSIRGGENALYERWVRNDLVPPMKENKPVTDYECPEKFTEYFRDILLGLKYLEDDIQHFCDQLKQLTSEISSVEQQMCGVLFSDESINRIQSRIDKDMKDLEEKMMDPEISATECYRYKKEMDRLSNERSICTLEFLSDVDPDGLFRTYCDKHANDYTYNKYLTVMTTAEISPSSLQMFANFEEKYMDEFYHPFNNFFLFHIIRKIAHFNPTSKDDTVKIKLIIQALIGYTSHPEDCPVVKRAVERFYENFKDKREYFAKNNRLTSANAEKEGVDKTIVNDYYDAFRESSLEYITQMMVVDESSLTMSALDEWQETKSSKELLDTKEKIHILVLSNVWDPSTITLHTLDLMDLEVMRNDLTEKAISSMQTEEVEEEKETTEETEELPEESSDAIIKDTIMEEKENGED